ncbi:hypothetical protein [Corynebacterium sp.]|uniref:hypothetical protein n=1 Tax=Corynebacterium sp. TaxID=1720 RepID=UPI0026DD5CBC|nr:hypothetical protein [Corynebacterium sp.]MDO5076085.1 hypothetical protein [Corynebacterium sp.]
MPKTTSPSPRLHGIDLARALAILGMVYAHVGPDAGTSLSNFGDNLTRGFASATFAVLAGVSLSIMAVKPSASTFHRLLVRGIILMALGTILQVVQGSIAVVLIAIGIIFALLPPVTRWRSRWVLALFLAFLVIGPGVQVLQQYLTTFAEVLGMPYPAVTWLTYGTLGILIHRHVVHSAVWQSACVILGAGIAAAGVSFREPFSDKFQPDELLGVFLSPEPHLGGLFDVLASCGAASATIGGCLLLVRGARQPLYPLRALGAMSLTFYVCHVITAGPILDHFNALQDPTATTTAASTSALPPEVDPMEAHWEEYRELVRTAENYSDFSSAEQQFYERIFQEPQAGGDAPEEPSRMPIFWATLATGLLFAPLWLWFFRRGPLEWVMHRLIERAVAEPKPRPQPQPKLGDSSPSGAESDTITS